MITCISYIIFCRKLCHKIQYHHMHQVQMSRKLIKTYLVSQSQTTMTNVKACAIAQKRFKHVCEDNDELKLSVGSLEGMMTDMKGTVGNLFEKMEVLINMVGTLTDQGTQAPLTTSDGGCSSTHISASKGVPSPIQDTTNAVNNQRCEILNSDLDIIATGILLIKLSIFYGIFYCTPI